MPFAYYNRLNREQRRIYRLSDGIDALRLPKAAALVPLVAKLGEALKGEERRAVEAASQALLDALAQRLQVPQVELAVYSVRPKENWGELHGLYLPSEGRGRAKIYVWMRTAERKRVVAFRTFLRTLLHELCHHLDYELLKLPASFHTEGFYKRESSLFHQLVDPLGGAGV